MRGGLGAQVSTEGLVGRGHGGDGHSLGETSVGGVAVVFVNS